MSLEMRRPDGQVGYPLGRDPVGFITYTEDGYISVSMMSAGRSKFAAAISGEEPWRRRWPPPNLRLILRQV